MLIEHEGKRPRIHETAHVAPAECFPPDEHERIWAIQKGLDFPFAVYDVERAADGSVDMREIMRTVLARHDAHRGDSILDESRRNDGSLP